MSTFLFRCASNFIKQEIRAMARDPFRQHAHIDQTHLCDGMAAGDMAEDDAIDAAAEDIIRHPERYFSPPQRRVFLAMIDNGHVKRQDLATILGYNRASSLSMMLRRIKAKIAQIDVTSVGDFNHGDE
jgi:hypothetical protein